MKNFDCDIFCERAISLFGETGQVKLANAIGISQGTISSIKLRNIKSPGADIIFRIANYFNVSTDWLLGLTDIKSTDKATKELCDTLGLSEETIEIIKQQTFLNNALNFLFEQHIFINNFEKKHSYSPSSENFFSILDCLSQFIELHQKDEKQDVFFKVSQNGDILKGEVTYNFENELLSDDILGIKFANKTIHTPVFSIHGMEMQEILNKIIAQMQYYIECKKLPEYMVEDNDGND